MEKGIYELREHHNNEQSVVYFVNVNYNYCDFPNTLNYFMHKSILLIDEYLSADLVTRTY